MRSLIVLKGLVKSQKLAWVKKERLGNFLLDIDTVKKLFYRPDYKGTKEYLIRSFDDVVYRVFIQSLCSRLSTGTLVVVDMDNESLTSVEDLAEIYGYTVFYHIEKTPRDYINRNIKYASNQFLPLQKDLLKREVDDFRHLDLSQKILIDTYEDVELYWKPLTKPITLNNTDPVLHISDLHSHWSILNNMIPPVEQFPLTVFAGDYIDGPEKGGSRLLMDQILNYENKNVIFLEGNHELRLRKFLGYIYLKGKGKKIVSEVLESELSTEFLEKTSKEFQGIRMLEAIEMIRNMNKTLRCFISYQRGNNRYICTHAGLRWLEQLSPKFIGNVIYSSKNVERVDKAFSDKYFPYNYWSIHGHCKYNEIDFFKFPGVINFDTEDEWKVNYFINEANNVQPNIFILENEKDQN